MITNKQLDRICDLLVDYRKAIVELTTAAPEDRMAAAYEFVDIDKMVHEMLANWVEQEDTNTDDDGWIEWGGGECPVEIGTRVDVVHRDGDQGFSMPAGAPNDGIGTGPANAKDWTHTDDDGDIIAYRVVS